MAHAPLPGRYRTSIAIAKAENHSSSSASLIEEKIIRVVVGRFAGRLRRLHSGATHKLHQEESIQKVAEVNYHFTSFPSNHNAVGATAHSPNKRWRASRIELGQPSR